MGSRRHDGRSDAAAFFDADDTLLNEKSLAAYLLFFIDTPAGAIVRSRLPELRERVEAGATPEQIAPLYVHAFRDHSWDLLRQIGQEWFTAYPPDQLYNARVRDRLLAHRDAGERVVLVSGSWLPCLEPVAAHLGIDDVLCMTPRVRSGVLTGEIERGMLGEEKATAVRAFARQHDVSLAASSAYGDSPSDQHLLSMVGRPVAVGDDPELVRIAISQGWERAPRA